MRTIMMSSLTVWVLVALLVAGAHGDEDGAKAPLAAALEALAAGRYETAVELAGRVRAGSKDEARARYLAGQARLSLGRHKEAAKDFEAVLALRPEAVPALVALGRAQEGLGDLEAAEARYRAALKLEPKDADALRALGELLLRDPKRQKEAEKTLRAARKQAPKDPFTARALVEALLHGDQERRAEAVARKQVRARPKHPMGHFLHALVLERRKKHDEAIQAYEKALALDGRFLDAHKNLAVLCITINPTYQDKERTKKAMTHFERYFALGGKDAALERTYRTIKAFLERNGG